MILSGPCSWVWAGRGCSCGGGGWLSCAVVRVAGCRVLCGVENTPAAAWFGGGGCPCLGVACCRGSGAVRPGCPARFSASLFVGGGGGCGWVGCELYSGREHLTVRFLRQNVFCFVRVSLLFVFLSVRWMPWHQGPMKDVVACDIPRGAGWRAVIRGFPNGGTRHELCRVTCI